MATVDVTVDTNGTNGNQRYITRKENKMLVVKCDTCGVIQDSFGWNAKRRVKLTIDGKEIQLCPDCEKRVIRFIEKIKLENEGRD